MFLIKFFAGFFYLLGQLSLQQNVQGPLNDNGAISKKSISEADLESYKKDEEFNYETLEAEDNIIERFFQWLENALQSLLESIFGVDAATGIVLFIFRVLPYLLLAFLIFLLFRFFLRLNSNNYQGKSHPKGVVSISEEEQIIKNEDIRALIDSAIKNGNFRLAIRYYYLLVLKALTQTGAITWQAQKTNEDYLNEIQDKGVKADFEKITRVYDYIWYGEFGIDAERYMLLKKDFEGLNSKLTVL
jgi:large-conductance mechanosensitive channel